MRLRRLTLTCRTAAASRWLIPAALRSGPQTVGAVAGTDRAAHRCNVGSSVANRRASSAIRCRGTGVFPRSQFDHVEGATSSARAHAPARKPCPEDHATPAEPRRRRGWVGAARGERPTPIRRCRALRTAVGNRDRRGDGCRPPNGTPWPATRAGPQRPRERSVRVACGLPPASDSPPPRPGRCAPPASRDRGEPAVGRRDRERTTPPSSATSCSGRHWARVLEVSASRPTSRPPAPGVPSRSVTLAPHSLSCTSSVTPPSPWGPSSPAISGDEAPSPRGRAGSGFRPGYGVVP